jgi:sporulation protein YlmC with PRC-barrel domain
MNRRLMFSLAVLGMSFGLLGVWSAAAQERLNQRDPAVQREIQRDSVQRDTVRTDVRISEELPAHLVRVSDVTKIAVYGRDGEELGKIHEVVLDLNGGCVSYAVVSFGGFLGIGDKYFAVPWQALKLTRTQDRDHHFVIGMTTERLKNAPGFDKERWPNFADDKFTGEVDRFYGIDRRQTGFRPGQREGQRDLRDRDRTNRPGQDQGTPRRSDQPQLNQNDNAPRNNKQPANDQPATNN